MVSNCLEENKKKNSALITVVVPEAHVSHLFLPMQSVTALNPLMYKCISTEPGAF